MPLSNVSRLAYVSAALALVVGSASCGGDAKPAARERATTPSPSPTPSPTPSLSPSPSPSPTPALLSPLTGLPVARQSRTLAVKVDNAPLARRFQVGLDKADVVYEELAEAGLTRFLAVFASQPAAKIGPVRSVRESDLELIRQYGKVLFGFSGGNKGVLRTVRGAAIVDVSYDAVPRAYTVRKGQRADADNFYTSTERLLTSRKGGEPAKAVGFRFGTLPPAAAAARPVSSVSVSFSDKARTGFTFDPANNVWLRSTNGIPSTLSDGGRMRAGTVVVQHIPVRQSRYVDVQGSPTPYSVTVGGGPAEIYRDGRVISGRWVRPNASSGTRFVYAGGTDIPFKPGPVWVLLVPQGARVVTG
ncbi:MAG TPA: DUF3048 domain-containing protein [Mycobacteriales bacterium]|nr:DUF3048 domain-containing protein [Mycobacteriales bacterium]